MSLCSQASTARGSKDERFATRPPALAHDMAMADQVLEIARPQRRAVHLHFVSRPEVRPTYHLARRHPRCMAVHHGRKLARQGIWRVCHREPNRLYWPKGENIIRARALFIDMDNADSVARAQAIIQETRVEPSMRVMSSAGRMHAYWLSDDLLLDEFKPLQRAVAERFGSDKSVVDLPRVMRLPGTWRLKGTPQFVELKAAHPRRSSRTAAIVTSLRLDRLDEYRPAAPKGEAFSSWGRARPIARSPCGIRPI